MLDDEQWRRATAMPTPADGTNAVASTEGEESGGEGCGGEESGGEEDAVAAGTRARVAARRPRSIANWPTCLTGWTTSGKRRPCGRTISLC